MSTEEKADFMQKLAMVLPGNDNRAVNKGRERNPPRNRDPTNENRGNESPQINPLMGSMPFMDQMNPR